MEFEKQAKRVLDDEELTPEEKVKELQERLEYHGASKKDAAKKPEKRPKGVNIDTLVVIVLYFVLVGFIGGSAITRESMEKDANYSAVYLNVELSKKESENEMLREMLRKDNAQLIMEELVRTKVELEKEYYNGEFYRLLALGLNNQLKEIKDELAKTKSELEAAKNEAVALTAKLKPKDVQRMAAERSELTKKSVAPAIEKPIDRQNEKQNQEKKAQEGQDMVRGDIFGILLGFTVATIMLTIGIDKKSFMMILLGTIAAVLTLYGVYLSSKISETGQQTQPLVHPAPVSTQGEAEKPNPKPWY